MMAQAQLDDAKSCDRKLIGDPAPFVFDSWKVNSRGSRATPKPELLAKDSDGKPATPTSTGIDSSRGGGQPAGKRHWRAG